MGGSSLPGGLFRSGVKIALLAALVALAPFAARADEPVASLDVKDEDARVVLKDLQKQCGIKNLLIDKEVGGRAMFYLRDVPCSTAFAIVAHTFQLRIVVEENSVVDVRPRR
jgi:hypothetical protein